MGGGGGGGVGGGEGGSGGGEGGEGGDGGVGGGEGNVVESVGCVPASGEGKGTGEREMSEEEIQYTESQIRRAALEKHVAAFLRKGGKVQELAMDATGCDRSGKLAQPFVINNHVLPPKKPKQYWKEHKHGK